MNLFSLATRGIDLDALPYEDEPSPRKPIAFDEPAGSTGRFTVPSDLNAAFEAAASEFGVDPDVLRAVAHTESRFNPDIISGKVKSSAGAIGLMQFMPNTAKEYGIDPTDPIQAIFGGAAYLRKSLDKFDGDYGKAVASYNAGPNRKDFDAEDWDKRMPAETQDYLRKVFTAADSLKQGNTGSTPAIETKASALPAGVTASTAGGGRGSVSPGDINTKLTRTAVPDMTAGSVAQDVLSGALQIGPTAVKGVGELIRLATGDRLGKGVTDFAERGIKATQDVVGSDRAAAQRQNLSADMADDSVGLGSAIANNKGALADQILPTIGSMILPVGVAGVAGKAATVGKVAQGLDTAALAARVASVQQAAGIGATAAQNAASTFAELVDKGVSMQDAYKAAGITVPFSLLAGKLTGGGAEGALIKGLSGQSISRGVGEVGKGMVREGAQEGGESLGQVAGEVLGANQDLSLESGIKRVGTEALLGAVMGGGMNAAQQMAPKVESQPTTPQAPTGPAAPTVAPAANPQSAQAVDVIQAILEAERNADTTAAPVQPTSQAADAGTAPVDAGAEGASAGPTGVAAADDAGEPEPKGALTQPSNFSATPTATVGTQTAANAGPGFTATGLAAEMAALKARNQPQVQPVQQTAPAPAPATSLAAEMAALKARNQATATVDPAKPVVNMLGRDNTPISEGGLPFKTKAEAAAAKKQQPLMRVKREGSGYVLVDKTPAQIAAQEKAAKRLGGVGSGGAPLSAHAFIAADGGMNISTMSELGFDKNVKVGAKWLFTKTGKTLEGMTEALQQNGYMDGTEQNKAIDLFKRSANGQPQYTAEGWAAVAQAETTARFEDHLAAQQEAEELDPFSPASVMDDDFDVSGYDDASPSDNAEFTALLAAAEAEGIDTEAILEQAAQQTQDGTDADYRNQARALIAAARSERIAVAQGAGAQQGRQDAQREGTGNDRAGTGREGAPGDDGEGLTTYTPAEVTARQDAAAQAESAAKSAEEAAARAEAAAKQASEIAQRSVAAADTFELGGNAEDNLSGQQGLKFSFAGSRAESADRMALMTAQDRIDAGDDAETVRQETGWFKGVDGRWRFEISDNEAKVDTTLLGNLARGGFDARPIEFITYRQEAGGTYSLSLSPANPTRTSDFVSLSGVPESLLPSLLPMQAQEAIQRGDGEADIIGPNMDDAKRVRAPFQFEGFNALPLEVVMDHPKLFAAYPALREIMVRVDTSLGNGATFAEMDYVDGTKGKEIRIGNPKAANVDNVLLHEIQHGIQSIEGFATGGSPNGNAKAYAAQLSRELSDLIASDGRLEAAYRAFEASQNAMEQAFSSGQDFDADAAQRNEDALTAMPNGQKVLDMYFSLAGLESDLSAPSVMRDRYKRLAGEVEARNTQARQRMTDAERRNTAPSATADVADDDVIVVMNGKEMASAPMPENAQGMKPTAPRTPISTITQAITKAYGNALTRLQGKGLVTLTQTEDEALKAAAAERAKLNGTSEAVELRSLRASVSASMSPMKSIDANVRRGLKSLAKALDEKTSVNRAMFRNGLGWVDFVWGDAGVVKPNGRTKGAMGISHILEARQRKDGMSDAEAVALLESVVEAIASGTEFNRAELDSATRVGVEKGGTIVWLTKQKGSNAWVVTAYEKNPDGANAGRATSAPTSPAASRTRDQRVAGFADIMGLKDVDVKRSADGHIQGFHDPATGKSFLISDNLTAETAPAVFMHEVGVHMAADGKLQPMFDRAVNLLKMARDNAFIKRVQERMDTAGETSGEEAAAYIVEEYERDRTNAPASVSKWIKDFIADVRAWLFSKGVLLKADQLTVADIAAVARANVRGMANEGGWTGYAKIKDAFRFGNTDGQRSKDIAEVADAFSGDGIELEGYSAFGGVQVGVRIKDAPSYQMEFKVQPGDVPLVIDAGRANGETGQSPGGNAGQRMYQTLFAWAHNNGRKVDADYTLSYVNELRRTSAMLSSALRFGTVDHFGEVNEQQNVDGWDAGNYEASVKALATAELRKVEQRVPVFASLEIDPTTGDVYTRDSTVLEQLRNGMDSEASVDGAAGADEQGSGGTGNLAALERGLAARKNDPRRSDGMPQDTVGAQARGADTVGDAASVQGDSLSDSELARYLASTRGGFESHGVGVSTLKRALITRDHNGSSVPGLLYSVAAPTSQPLPQKPQRSAWKDEQDRVQFAPGSWLFDKLGKVADPVLSWAGMKAASPELKKQLRTMKLGVQKAQETSAKIATETAKLTQDEREMVSDLIEKTLKAGVVPPAHAVKLAALINQTMSAQTDELIDLGMLSKEAAERWRGEYLPRFYASKLRKGNDSWADALKNITKRVRMMQGIKGKHLKSRGLFETVDAGQIADYEALGWELRDDGYEPGKSTTAQMWRDFTPEERENMGEIKDAGFRFVMGYMQTQKDIALGRMFKSIAETDTLSSRLQTGKFTVQVPDTKVEGTGANVYGALAGRYVSKDVLDHLSGFGEAHNDVLQVYRKAMSLWKEGKTVLNPVSHVNNTVSNITMAHLAGVGYHRVDKYAAAARDFATNSKLIEQAKDAGLFLGSFNQAELFDAMPPELKELAKMEEGKGTKVVNGLMQALSFGMRNHMGKAYEFEDSFFKYVIFRDSVKRGMSPEDAVDYAQKFIFTYDDLPKTARKIRDFGIPFFAYTYKAVPALLETTLKHPERMALPASMIWAATTLAYAVAAGGDDEPLDELIKKYATDKSFRDKVGEAKKFDQAHLPKWMRGYTSLAVPKAIRVGTDAALDMPVFMDISRLIPGGDLFDVTPNAGGLPLPQPITPNHPILTMAMGMLGNKDMFTGKDLVKKSDSDSEAAEARLKWIYKQVAPAIAFGNYHSDRALDMIAGASDGKIEWLPEFIAERYTGVGRDEMKVQPKYAIPQTFGIKLRPIDQDKAEDFDRADINKLIKEIDADMRGIHRQNNAGIMSDTLANKRLELHQLKKDRLREGLTVDGDTKD